MRLKKIHKIAKTIHKLWLWDNQDNIRRFWEQKTAIHSHHSNQNGKVGNKDKTSQIRIVINYLGWFLLLKNNSLPGPLEEKDKRKKTKQIPMRYLGFVISNRLCQIITVSLKLLHWQPKHIYKSVIASGYIFHSQWKKRLFIPWQWWNLYTTCNVLLSWIWRWILSKDGHQSVLKHTAES